MTIVVVDVHSACLQ